MGSYLFLTQIKWRCDTEQIAQGDFQYTISVMLTKGVFVFVAPVKVYNLKSNIRKRELLWTECLMSC